MASSPAAVMSVNRRTEPVTEPWSFGRTLGECIDTGTHRIHSTLRDPVIRERMQVFLPTALDHYRAALIPLPEPDGPIDVFLFGSRTDWMAYTRERLPQEAAMYEQIGRGGYTIEGDAVLYDIGRWDTFTIAAHEGWHAYSQRVLRHALPVWLEEGIACFMEGFRQPPGAPEPSFLPWRNPERYAELRSAARKERLAPLREVLEGSPQSFLEVSRDSQLSYYAQVWALVHFIRDGEDGRYRAGLEQLLADAVSGGIPARIRSSPAIPDARGRRIAEQSKAGIWLVLAYLDDDYDRFERGYDRFVGSLIESNAWDRIMRGESPIAPAPAPQPAAPPR